MRVGIYGRMDCHELEALEKGLRADGHAVVQRSASDYTKGETEAFDLVAVSSLRGKNQLILSDYRAKGVEVLVLDFGYLRRTNHASDPSGYFQVSRNGLSQVPSFACPSDRFDSLGFEVPATARTDGEYVLILGQVPGDASHGMNQAQLEAWYAALVDRVRADKGRAEIVFRPHPLAPEVECPIADRRSSATLAEDLDGADIVLAHSSTALFEALLAGRAIAAQSGPCEPIGNFESGPAPLVGDPLRAFLSRVAYGQWTLDEIASGEAVRFVLHGLPDVAEEPAEEELASESDPAPTATMDATESRPKVLAADEFSKPELVKLAKKHGVDPTGSKSAIVARINARLAAE